MSTTLIFGNFTVAAGTIVNPPNNGRLSYAIYETSVYMQDLESYLPAFIRCFLQTGMTPFPENTTVFLYGKISASTTPPLLIEAINMFPYTGDPTDPNYGLVPAFSPRIVVLGHASGSVETSYEGRRIFKVLSAAWVRDQLQASSFMAFFENTIRWKKTNAPNSGSAINMIGPLTGRHQDNQLPLLNIEDITFNAGSRHDQGESPQQRGKFVPRVRFAANSASATGSSNGYNTLGGQDTPIVISSGESSSTESTRIPNESILGTGTNNLILNAPPMTHMMNVLQENQEISLQRPYLAAYVPHINGQHLQNGQGSPPVGNNVGIQPNTTSMNRLLLTQQANNQQPLPFRPTFVSYTGQPSSVNAGAQLQPAQLNIQQRYSGSPVANMFENLSNNPLHIHRNLPNSHPFDPEKDGPAELAKIRTQMEAEARSLEGERERIEHEMANIAQTPANVLQQTKTPLTPDGSSAEAWTKRGRPPAKKGKPGRPSKRARRRTVIEETEHDASGDEDTEEDNDVTELN
ncbi:hypothetical protein M422DRAFT_246925 [Sphaerobolus stellatus SS14]|nr:hypothetical protein M422DRAFT_246925 [Sphaerobolus stellatus SS14]